MHRTIEELEAAVAHIQAAPKDAGVVELIVSRPVIDGREVLHQADLDVRRGLIGDSWEQRPSRWTADHSPHPSMQINIMSARAIAAIAGDRSRWPLAGDQLFVDLDLSAGTTPPGTRLRVGTATLQVADRPHTGCDKFAQRFGVAAAKLVNSPAGRALNLRGVNARIVESGVARPGDLMTKEAAIEIRPAGAADLPHVRACLAEAFEPYRAQYTPEMFTNTVPDLDALAERAREMSIWVACAPDGTIVGTIAGSARPDGTGHLRGMAISHTHHGAGVAARLLMTAEHSLRRAECSAVTLHTTAPLVRAANFYHKHGYRPTGRTADQLGMALIEHRKTL